MDTCLGVALGAERARLEHGELVEEAALVHVQPGVHVVEGGAHACLCDCVIVCVCVCVMCTHIYMCV
jgi:hypothetical protein